MKHLISYVRLQYNMLLIGRWVHALFKTDFVCNIPPSGLHKQPPDCTVLHDRVSIKDETALLCLMRVLSCARM